MTEKPLTTGKHYLGKHTCVLRVHAGVSCHMFGMQLTLNVMCPAEMLKGFVLLVLTPVMSLCIIY